jgi:hypothetical protein
LFSEASAFGVNPLQQQNEVNSKTVRLLGVFLLLAGFVGPALAVSPASQAGPDSPAPGWTPLLLAGGITVN